MAYTNGIFYLDLVNGSDAARTTFAPTNYSNNGSGVVRVNRTAHGLVTGAVIDITGTTSNVYNGAWKITRIDADNFDLDTSTYSVNPASKGTVSPRGGSSWTDAWRTLNLGATAARIDPSDTIRIAKTGDPTSIGNATWTSKSATVTLAAAQTTNIYLDGTWTAANSATTTTTTTRKEGSNASQITTPAATATSTKYAYYTIGGGAGVDLSSYDAITFWFRPPSIADANRYTIRLCSDTIGDTTVDTFTIPAIASSNFWVPLTITRNGGGNLGNSIQSIALYTGTTSPGNSQQVIIDNVVACNNTGLNLTALISKNSQGYGGSDVWYPILSINNTTVTLSNLKTFTVGGTNRGYYTTGTSPQTVTTYVRPTFKFAIQTTNFTSAQPIQDSGTAGNPIVYSGGWDTATTTQNGTTWIDGQIGQGFGFDLNSKAYITIDRINVTGFGYGYNLNAALNLGITATGLMAVGCGISMYLDVRSAIIEYISVSSDYFIQSVAPNGCSISIKAYNSGSPVADTNSVGNTYENLEIYNSAGTYNLGSTSSFIFVKNFVYQDNAAGVTFRSYANIQNATIVNNTTALNASQGTVYINRLTASGNTTIGAHQGVFKVNQTNATSSQLIGSTANVSRIHYTPAISYGAVNNDINDNRSYWAYGNAISQTTTRKSASGIAWQINITDTRQNINVPILFPIAKVACNANSLVTVKAWVKLSHATDIGAKLLIQAYEIAGVSADVTATKSADTNWEELTITFTPTVAGVAQIYVQGYWLANLADESIFVDDVTVSQA